MGKGMWILVCLVGFERRERRGVRERERERQLWVALNVWNVEAFGSGFVLTEKEGGEREGEREGGTRSEISEGRERREDGEGGRKRRGRREVDHVNRSCINGFLMRQPVKTRVESESSGLEPSTYAGAKIRVLLNFSLSLCLSASLSHRMIYFRDEQQIT